MNAHGQPFKILAVDDNPANLELAQEILDVAGYATVVASSAEEAEELMARDVPDLILLDVRLPGIDGITFLRQLRSSPAFARLPVVAMSAQAMPGEVASGMAAGFDAYVVKPIAEARLLDAIRNALQRSMTDMPTSESAATGD